MKRRIEFIDILLTDGTYEVDVWRSDDNSTGFRNYTHPTGATLSRLSFVVRGHKGTFLASPRVAVMKVYNRPVQPLD